MFHTRLKVFIAAWAVPLALVVARLVQLQVVQAEQYARHARQVLELAPKALPFVRGRIVDRTARVLVSDEPSWDVLADYGLLAGDEGYISRLTKRFRKEERYGKGLSADEIRKAFLGEMDRMWEDLSRFSGVPAVELHRRVEDLRSRIQNIREAVTRRRGFEATVREELIRHAILTGLNDQEQVRARLALEKPYPWLVVEDSTKRVLHDVAPMAHVLGRIGPVDAEDIRNDPQSDDPLARYLPHEITGKSGVEAAAERLLRGSRGRLRTNLEGDVLENLAARNGRDVTLTVRHDLQSRLYRKLGEALLEHPDSPGGVIIVLDIPTREVLAMVSYPSYDPNRFLEDYDALRKDTLHQPLRFRAAANQYAPGSIAKPLACIAGLASGKITLDTRFNCTGYRFPGVNDKWRCWKIPGSGARRAHESINVVQAIEGSCNVFLYHVGEEVGMDYLTGMFDMFGLGRPTGIGLPEEAVGVNPTPDWLAKRGRSATAGTPRLLAIGQAELLVTPVQVANMVATYATGVYKPVTLIRGLSDPAPEWKLPGEPEHWQAIREGLFRVVNSEDGTAYHYARYEGAGYRICGKTGSATTPQMPLSYRVRYTDENEQKAEAIVPAGSRAEAADDFARAHPNATVELKDIEVHERWPVSPEESYSHAWFVGFLQAVDEKGLPLWNVKPRIAFVVLVEFGGSGGRTSGPIAQQIVPMIIERLGPDLDPDWVAPEFVGPPAPEVVK